jgi:hypothetical protein
VDEMAKQDEHDLTADDRFLGCFHAWYDRKGQTFQRCLLSPSSEAKKAVPLYAMKALAGEEVQLLHIPDHGTR